MRTPDTRTLWLAYTTKLYLNRADVIEIFGCSSAKATQMMRAARQAQRGLPQFSAHSVRTKEAFATWNIDTEELKQRIKEIRK